MDIMDKSKDASRYRFNQETPATNPELEVVQASWRKRDNMRQRFSFAKKKVISNLEICSTSKYE